MSKKEEKEIKSENAATNEQQPVQEAQDTTEAQETEESTEETPLEKATREAAEYKDKYLRTLADFDNYRKHTLKEKADLILNGGEKTITAILPILDDMERAIANATKVETKEAIEEGWELINKKLLNILESLGVKAIDTKDADFNTDFHDAIALVPGMGDDKKGKVIDCTLTGYTLNDKVIRHAKVAVGQ